MARRFPGEMSPPLLPVVLRIKLGAPAHRAGEPGGIMFRTARALDAFGARPHTRHDEDIPILTKLLSMRSVQHSPSGSDVSS